MKANNAMNFFVILIFLFILVLPILFINRIPDKISDTENRKLTSFPDIFDGNGDISPGLKSKFESWINDNIGFREQFLKIAANIKVKALHISTSEKVHIGKDGWYFYTQDDNLKIANGEYPLDDFMLKTIAKNQQIISDYYKSRGIEYVLILTPSKASVYPEYIGDADYHVDISPIDMVENYLHQYTDVNVLNTKNILIQNKNKNKLFLKTDTHFTQYGSYLVYQSIYNHLKESAILFDDQVADLQFSEGTQQGEFSAMFGVKDLLPAEKVPVAQWERHVNEIKTGAYFEKIDHLCKQNQEAKRYQPYICENPNVEDKTLLIYGDSQWAPMRNIPILLGEHFSNVVSLRFRSPNISVDEVVQPNIIIFGCSERFINTILLRNPTVPALSQLPDLPTEQMISQEDYGAWIANKGICLDTCNDNRLEGRTDIQLKPDALSVKLYGWAADFLNDAPFKELYLRIGNTIVKCEYGIERTSVVDHFKKDSLLKTGFQTEFPITYLQGSPDTEIAFIAVSTDGKYLYEPVTYQLHF